MFPLWRSKPQTGTVSDTRGHTSGQTDFLRHLPASSPLFDVSHIKVSEESRDRQTVSILRDLFYSPPDNGAGSLVASERRVLWTDTVDVQGKLFTQLWWCRLSYSLRAFRGIHADFICSAHRQETDGIHLCLYLFNVENSFSSSLFSYPHTQMTL